MTAQLQSCCSKCPWHRALPRIQIILIHEESALKEGSVVA